MAAVISRRVALTALAGSLVALRAPAAKAADKLRVGKAVIQVFGYMPLDIGMKYGFFQKHGLEIEELNFGGGAKLAQAMTAGAVDIGLSGGPDMAFVAKGAPEIAIASIAASSALMGIFVGEQSTAHGIDDLKGQKIGVTSPGSLTNWLVLELNLVKGWTGADRAVPVVIGAPTALLAALKTGLVYAITFGMEVGYELEARHAGRVLLECSAYVPDIELEVIFASTAITRHNPEAVRRFLAAWCETVAFMNSHKAETVQLTTQVIGYAPEVSERLYDTMMAKLSTDGKFEPKALETLRQSFVDLKVVKPPIDIAKLYTDEFLPKA